MAEVKRYALIENGLVINIILWDGEAEYNPGDNIVIIQNDLAEIGDFYSDGVFSKPPKTDEEIKNDDLVKTNMNLNRKSTLMSKATERVSILQDAVDLEMATSEEVALLTKWKKYRVLLSRIDANTPSDITWPAVPEVL